MKNLDEYVAKADSIKIKYPSCIKSENAEPSAGAIIIKNPNIKTINRRKHIFFEDTQKFQVPTLKDTKLLSCRNPFRMDD